MLTGIYQHSIDVKGRVFVPSALRQELGKSFQVTVGFPNQDFKMNCIAVYPDKSWSKVEDRYDAMSRKDKSKMRPIFAHARKLEVDDQGRILLPQNVREWAQLKKNVAIVGVGDSVEIWDAEVWEKIDALETSQENIASIYDENDF